MSDEKLIKENFRNISDESMDKVKEYSRRFGNMIDDIFDYHFEETEEALFNWMHHDTSETPMEIKNAAMPSDLANVLHVKEGWFFWYV